MVKFRHPKEMESKEKRSPVSTRLKDSTKEALEKAAKAHDLTLAELISNILDDYSDWLSQSRR